MTDSALSWSRGVASSNGCETICVSMGSIQILNKAITVLLLVLGMKVNQRHAMNWL